MNADGSAPTNLSSNSAADMFPSVSAGGGRIAFTQLPGRRQRRDLRDERGRQRADPAHRPRRRRLAADLVAGRAADRLPHRPRRRLGDLRDERRRQRQANITQQPAASTMRPPGRPTARRIAFETDRDGNREIYVMNADGSAPVNLTNTPDQTMSRPGRPDGQRIAFRTDRDGNDEIYSMTPDRRLCRRGSRTTPAPTRSPPGRRTRSKIAVPQQPGRELGGVCDGRRRKRADPAHDHPAV